MIEIKSNYIEICNALSDKQYFTRRDFSSYVKEYNPYLKDNSIGWLLYNLCQKQVIEHIAHNTYRVYKTSNTLQDYKPILSADALNIFKYIKKRFPLIDFIIWETRAFNEFSNHQVARNFIFIEVEKPLGESVFESIRDRDKFTVLYKPNEKEITMYSDDVTISVLHLTSEAPINEYRAKLEKLLVDLFANKLLDNIISRGDYPGIYEEAFSRYSINHSMMFRYAKRRNKDIEIKHFINEQTNITLIGSMFR